MRQTKTILVSLLLLGASLCMGLPIDDEVTTAIPGYNHAIYSGYLDIEGESDKKEIHYVYLESQDKPRTDPVIIWLAGGPGCSSLLSMFQENGPFVYRPGSQQLTLNKHSWNKRAGLVYFQNPAGVGFSLGSQSSLKISEEAAVQELYTTLVNFLNRHKKLLPNKLYLSGSGYGAALAARLARKVSDENQERQNKINLKGLLLGNPCVHPDECFSPVEEKNSVYHYEFLFKRGFFSKQKYGEYLAACLIPLDPLNCYQKAKQLDDFYLSTNTSLYNIYSKCYSAPSGSNSINMGCEDEAATIAYLNDPHFRENWNIRGEKKWEPCSQKIQERLREGNGTFHLLNKLLTQDHLRIWVYSGDTDSSVPFSGTRNWVNLYKQLHQVPVLTNWREWWVPGQQKGEDQVGGFVWVLEGLTVVLVKGAGFRAPGDKPQPMMEVVTAFLDNSALPYKGAA